MIFTLGSRIQKYRRIKELTQKQLAKMVGVHRTTISSYENDLRQPPNCMLIRLSEALRVSTDELLGRKCSQTIDVSGLAASDIKTIADLVERLREKHGNK